ncbi:uncharacterized protein VTP21DRAFT_11705 [Calcarisporiella thermophila]|uniref:uncharacterized protein n=1 Tax=Calcarisporiella thermophila TaxID=911321 RepID=UPI0037445405
MQKSTMSQLPPPHELLNIGGSHDALPVHPLVTVDRHGNSENHHLQPRILPPLDSLHSNDTALSRRGSTDPTGHLTTPPADPFLASGIRRFSQTDAYISTFASSSASNRRGSYTSETSGGGPPSPPVLTHSFEPRGESSNSLISLPGLGEAYQARRHSIATGEFARLRDKQNTENYAPPQGPIFFPDTQPSSLSVPSSPPFRPLSDPHHRSQLPLNPPLDTSSSLSQRFTPQHHSHPTWTNQSRRSIMPIERRHLSSEAPYSRPPELRISHKLAERKRRKEIKDLFDELRNSLPFDRNHKASKWEVLSKALEYIQKLKGEEEEMAREIEGLRQQIESSKQIT